MSLGSIVVRLSMNTADFETDAGRAAKIAERRAKEIDKSFTKAGIAIGTTLGNYLTRAIDSAASAFPALIDRMDDISKSAQKVGMGTEVFSQLVYAGDLADVQMETLVSTLGKLTKAQAASLKSGSEQAKVFEALGMSAKNADGSLRDSSEVLLDFADKFAALDGSPEAMAAGFALFGKSFQEMIPLLKDGGGAIEQAMMEADKLGKTLSTEAGQAAEEFNDNLTRLKSAVGGVWMEIASGMLPQLNAMTGDMVAAAKETDNLREFGQGLATVLQGLGSGFAFVSGMTKQFTIDTLALSDALLGYAEAAKNIGTLGLASGSVDGGMGRAANAWQSRRDLMAKSSRDAANASAEANIARLIAGGTAKYDGPALPGLFGSGKNDEAEALRKRLAAALGGGAGKSGGSGKSKKEELTEEQKAAKALNEEYARTLESMQERVGMLGLETEASKMQWETENGRFKDLAPQQKAELIAQAGLLDAKQSIIDEIEREERARADAQKGYEAAIKDIQSERETLGMTNEQLEIYNRLKWAGVDANSAFGKSIIEQTEAMQAERKSMHDRIGLMDDFRGGAADALTDFVTGAKSAQEALGDFFDDMARRITQMIAERWMEQLFGQMGSSQTGSSGGGIWDFFGKLFGAYAGASGGGMSTGAAGSSMWSWAGAGYAGGGWTGPGGMNEVAGPAHRNEVVWSQTDVARAGGVAAVEAARRSGGRSGGSVTVINNISAREIGSRRTQQQIAQEAGLGVRRALARA